MNKTSKRILAVGLPLTAVAVTGAGIAYWTASGSGSVAGSAAAEAAAVTLRTTSPVTGLMPGRDITVGVTAANPNATTRVSIAGLTAGAVTSDKGGCDGVSGVTAVAAPPSSPVLVPAAGQAAFGTVTITMPDSDTDQSACKGATFTVALTAS